MTDLKKTSLNIADNEMRKLAQTQQGSLSLQYHLESDTWHGTIVGAFGLRTAHGGIVEVIASLQRMHEDRMKESA